MSDTPSISNTSSSWFHKAAHANYLCSQSANGARRRSEEPAVAVNISHNNQFSVLSAGHNLLVSEIAKHKSDNSCLDVSHVTPHTAASS
ncbi:hypothetical protein F2P81_013251 [Scophthalmus maximus]|uniref:Uncharacterized protein n=1 Tax=Scophthalmus maximus TaxID=52904 RepID=A0A6A4SNE1_SCOMX|nr:hypothetical protein F2P81_013251 [Scophthalmus maximus]